MLISTIIQSRLPLSHFPLNPLIMPTSFSKLSWEFSSGDFHLRLMSPYEARLTQHCSLTVLSASPEINCTLVHFRPRPNSFEANQYPVMCKKKKGLSNKDHPSCNIHAASLRYLSDAVSNTGRRKLLAFMSSCS